MMLSKSMEGMGRKFRKIENFVDKNSIGVYAENTMNDDNNPDNGGACQYSNDLCHKKE